MDFDFEESIFIKIMKGFLAIFPILSIMFGVFVYTPEYNGSQNQEGVKAFLDYKWNFQISRLMTILLVCSITCAVLYAVLKYLENIQSLKRINVTLKNENQKLMSKLSQTKGQIFSTTNEEKILKAMETFAINNYDVISVQLYKYRISLAKSNTNYEVIPTNMNYIKNGNVTNQVFEQYTVRKTLLTQYDKVKNEFNKGNFNPLEKFISKITKELKKFDQDSSLIIKDEDSIKYAILILSLQLNFGQTNFKFEGLSTKTQSKLANIKRTGFLRSMIENTYYKFEHEGDSGKGQRVYITKCLPIENTPHMFVITLNPNILRAKDSTKAIDNIGKKFYDILSNDLLVVYNNFVG